MRAWHGKGARSNTLNLRMISCESNFTFRGHALSLCQWKNRERRAIHALVIKKSGRRVPFDRDKLLRSVEIAVRKRNVDPERIDRAVTGIVRQLESSGETEVTSGEIGRLVMEALKSLDDVAYVRFASVYRNFREAKDFHEVLGELKGDEDSG